MTDLVVTTRGDVVDAADGLLSLREALAQAEAHAGADTITFDAGVFTPGDATILLTQGQLEITQAGGPVTIQGDLNGDHLPDVTIDAGWQSRVFAITGTSDSLRAQATLAGLTLTRGAAFDGYGSGGGIDASDVELRLTDCVVSDNSSYQGGGIAARGGVVTISGSTIEGNGAVWEGGGVYAAEADVSVVGSSIADNTSGALNSGGRGGGIFCSSSSCTIVNSTLSGNVARNTGGAFYNGSTPGAGGGVFAYQSSLDLVNSTVIANVARSADYLGRIYSGRGGGIWVAFGEAGVSNSIVAGNIVSGYRPDAASDIWGTIVSNGHNLFSETGITGATASDIIVPLDELFTSVFPPPSGGDGPILTYTLLPWGLAVDAGSTADAVDAAGDPLVVDQRGQPRIAGGAVDIGAVESAAGALVDGTEGPDHIVARPGGAGIRGFAGDDTLTGRDGADTLVGGDGDDLLRGENGRDYILAGLGDDTCGGGSGNDLSEGGNGDDVINGGGGNDTLRGDAGNDRIGGGYGQDSLAGGDGADTLVGGEGDDTIEGGAGNDTVGGGTDLHLGAGDDNAGVHGYDASIYGGDGNDTLSGSRGRLFGEAGNDSISSGLRSYLSGGAGDDTLNGGIGADTLIGGYGADRLRGAKGNDVFVFRAEAGAAGRPADIVVDFQPGTDHIRLDGLVSGQSGLADLLEASSGGTLALSTVGGRDVRLLGIDVHDLLASDFILV